MLPRSLLSFCYGAFLARYVSASLDQFVMDDGLISGAVLEYESVDGSLIQELDIASKFKRDELQIFEYENIEDWQVQNLLLSPGDYRAYNFSTAFSTSYSIIAYISANICRYPQSLTSSDALEDLVFYQSIDGGQTFSPVIFEEGYYESINYTPTPTSDDLLSILLYVEFSSKTQAEPTDIFQLQLGISVDDLVFQWDNGTFASVVDTDDVSAFFESSAFNSTSISEDEIINGTLGYIIHVFKNDETSFFEGLSKSWCAINSATALVSTKNIQSSYSNTYASLKKQFFVQGLNASSNYIAYITRDVSGTGDGGAVYSKLQFSTQKRGVCTFINNLEFCDDIAYSVPQSSAFLLDHNKTALIQAYDSYAEDVYSNFSKAIQQIDCYSEDDSRYSPLVSCSDCELAYKNWLCSVTIPRCTTIEQEEYKLRKVGESRGDYINDVIVPPSDYYEILPCIDLCYSIVRNCPSDFGFGCPSVNDTLLQSYNFLKGSNYTTCNLIGNSTTSENGVSLLSFPKWQLLSLFLVLALIL